MSDLALVEVREFGVGGDVFTHVRQINFGDYPGDPSHNAYECEEVYPGLFEPTQDYGITSTEQL